MDHGGLDFGSSRVALYSELVRGIRDLSSTTPSHLRALHRISRFGLLARWTLPVSGLAWGHNRTNQGRTLEKLCTQPFSPWRTRRTRDVGIPDDRRACERCRVGSALLVRRCHAGGFSSIRQLLPLWHGHVPTGLKHQQPPRMLAAAAATQRDLEVGARRPLRTLFGRHGTFARNARR